MFQRLGVRRTGENRTAKRFLPLRKQVIASLLSLLTGCTSYTPMPLDREHVDAALQTPSREVIALRIEELKRGSGKSLTLDWTDGVSPEEAAVLAVVLNPHLRALRDDRMLARAQLLEAGILPNPEISYDMEAVVGEKGVTGGQPFGLSLNWLPTSLIGRKDRIGSAEAHAKSVDLEVSWQEWLVAERAKLAAFRVSFSRELEVARREQVEDLELLAQATGKGLRMGVATARDVAETKAALLAARSSLEEASARGTVELAELHRVIGLSPAEEIPLEAASPLDPISKLPPESVLIGEIEHRRLDLRAYLMGYESQEARVRAAVRAQFPRIRFGLRGGRDTDGIETVGFGLSIEIPIFDRNQGKIAIQRASRQQLFDEYVARVFEARTQTHLALTRIRGLERQLAAARASTAEAKRIFDRTRQSVANGLETSRAYLAAIQGMQRARVHEISLRALLVEARLSLELATGDFGLVGNIAVDARESEEGRTK